jgi:30S ribosomal protein S31
MGRGDKRTAKGKRTRGTYGKSRPRKRNIAKKPIKAAAKAAS